MTAPKPPTLLEDLETIVMDSGYALGGLHAAVYRLRDFLSSPVVQALSDPGMRAALEVIVEGWPVAMDLDRRRFKAEHAYDRMRAESDLRVLGRNLIVRALKAKEEV